MIIYLNSPYASVETDPYWADVILYLDAQTSLTHDSSSYNRSLTTFGTPRLDNSIQLFGLQTYGIDAVTERIATNGSDSYFATEFGSGEWCIEYWIRPLGTGAGNVFATFSQFVFRWFSGEYVSFACTDIGGSSVALQSNALDVPLSEWSHIAFVRDNQDATFSYLRMFINGVLTRTSGGISKSASIGTAATFGRLIGYDSAGTYGNFNYLRVTKAHARYYADFSVPTAPYPKQ